jgi:hypothetical protein
LCFEQLFESGIVNAAIAKWRDQCRESAAKHWKRLKRYKGYKVKRAHSIVMSSEVETSLTISFYD